LHSSRFIPFFRRKKPIFPRAKAHHTLVPRNVQSKKRLFSFFVSTSYHASFPNAFHPVYHYNKTNKKMQVYKRKFFTLFFFVNFSQKNRQDYNLLNETVCA